MLMSLGTKSTLMFILALLAGACGSWLVTAYDNENKVLLYPIFASLFVVGVQALLAFVVKTPIENEMELVHDARLIEQKAKNDSLKIASEGMQSALQSGKLEKFQEFHEIIKELR